jgi:CDGSH-type Zn-finger protein
VSEDLNITVTENGPYRVRGSVPLSRQVIEANAQGESIGWRHDGDIEARAEYALCRCGHSANKPFCDGSHARVGFDGTETASRTPYLEQAGEQEGPTLILTDAQVLCASGRFCDVAGQIWNLVQQEGTAAAEQTAHEASLCPSGRLVVWDRKTKKPIEPEFEPSIGVIQDPVAGVGGPLWVRGGVTVTSAYGEDYERRNRVTLCRCGNSKNKPFCDSTHVTIGFSG